MLQCSFLFAAAQLLVKMTSALQKSECCSATSAAQHSENCSATSVFACGMLQGWGSEGLGFGLAEQKRCFSWQTRATKKPRKSHEKAKSKNVTYTVEFKHDDVLGLLFARYLP